jgi:hypothetical protein
MADNRLLEAIDTLRYENAQYHTANYNVQTEQTKHTENIARSIGELLTEFKNSRLDAEEARQDEAKKGDAEDTKIKGSGAPEREQFDLKGILAIVGGIGASIAGFVAGFASAITNGVKLMFSGVTTRVGNIVKGITTSIKESAIVKNISTRLKSMFAPVTRFIDALGDVFGKRGTGQILKGSSYKTLGNLTKYVRQFADFTKRVSDGFRSVGQASSGKIAQAIDKARDAIKAFGASINNILKSLRGLNQFGDLRAFAELKKVLNAKIVQPFTNFINGVKGVGESTSKIGKTLGKFFSAFKVIGRYVAFPLTIIMGIIDGFKGLQAGADRQVGMVDKIIGGAIGAITGVLKGLVAVPLDMLKSAVSWIAGKLGFTEFEKMLDSFSFADMFQMIGDKIADGFIKFFDGLTYWFTNIKDRLMAPFKEGFSFGAVVDLITSLPATIVGGIMDFAKNSLSALLNIFGAEDASTALDSFNFTDLLDSIVGRVGLFFSDMFGSISSSFMNIFNGDGPLLERLAGFAKNLVTSLYTWPLDLLKNVASSILGFFGMQDEAQALDSFSFKDTFGKIIDWIVAFPGKVVDTLMALFTGEVSIGELLSDAMSGAMNLASQFNEWLKGIIRQPLSDLAKGDSLIDRGLKALIPSSIFDWAGVDESTGNISAPKVSAPDTTARSDNGQRVSEMSRENEKAKNSATNVVVSAPVQTNQNVTNNSTSAVIDQNMPTVDQNDRSWGGNLTWQGGVGLV